MDNGLELLLLWINDRAEGANKCRHISIGQHRLAEAKYVKQLLTGRVNEHYWNQRVNRKCCGRKRQGRYCDACGSKLHPHPLKRHPRQSITNQLTGRINGAEAQIQNCIDDWRNDRSKELVKHQRVMDRWDTILDAFSELVSQNDPRNQPCHEPTASPVMHSARPVASAKYSNKKRNQPCQKNNYSQNE